MGKLRGYAGTVQEDVQCPTCRMIIYKPVCTTDGKNIFVECPYCAEEFEFSPAEKGAP